MMLLGVSERKVIVAVMARIEIEDLDAVEQLGGRRGALVAEGMRLNEQRAVRAVLGRERLQTLAHDALRVGQQLVMEAVQQIVVLRAVKAQLCARIDADAVLFALALETVVAEQEVAGLAARGGQVHFDVVEGITVVVVGHADGVVAGGGIRLHDGLCAEPAAVGNIGRVEVRFDFVHDYLSFSGSEQRFCGKTKAAAGTAACVLLNRCRSGRAVQKGWYGSEKAVAGAHGSIWCVK